jgi:hypothetical protein
VDATHKLEVRAERTPHVHPANGVRTRSSPLSTTPGSGRRAVRRYAERWFGLRWSDARRKPPCPGYFAVPPPGGAARAHSSASRNGTTRTSNARRMRPRVTLSTQGTAPRLAADHKLAIVSAPLSAPRMQSKKARRGRLAPSPVVPARERGPACQSTCTRSAWRRNGNRS